MDLDIPRSAAAVHSEKQHIRLFTGLLRSFLRDRPSVPEYKQ